MSADDINLLKEKVRDLQLEIASKDLELMKYRQELARVNHSLEKLIIDLDHELKMASKIQKILSPTEIPNIPGFEFSTKFNPGLRGGSDYFDIFEHEDKMKFGILISSSSGHTISALFLSILMKFSGHIEARKGLDPDVVLKQLGEEILPDMQAQDSISIFYAIIDRRNFEVRYSSLGKTLCFHKIYGEDNLVQIEGNDAPLTKEINLKSSLSSSSSSSPQSSFQPLMNRFQLNPRDRLILCSNGISQGKGSQPEEFGRNRLIEVIQKFSGAGVHELRNEILFQVEAYTQTQQPDYDQTIIIAEIKDRVIKLAKKS